MFTSLLRILLSKKNCYLRLMPPNSQKKLSTRGFCVKNDENEVTSNNKSEEYKVEIVWRNVILYIYFTVACLYGFWICVTSAKWATVIFSFISYHIAGLGITVGAHRLWTHRAYKAKLPLRIFLMLCNVMAYQYPIIYWARDHRTHHKHSETDADPHNAKRGFFFSHVGWLMCKKHPQVVEKGKQIDLSDLWADPVLKFQKKHYNNLVKLICFILPTIIPMYFWGETFDNAFHANICRYYVNLNVAFLVNSAAHLWGGKPYNKSIYPSENALVSFLAMGEGWHNYHHTFPWDYKTAELSYYLNLSTVFIDIMAKLGLAYDLKTTSNEFVKSRVMKNGDGSHDVWGWGDQDQTLEDQKNTVTLYGNC